MYRLLLLLFSVSCLLTSCSKEANDVEDNSVFKISKITIDEQNEDRYYKFSYDAQGRISKINCNYGSEEGVINVSYGDKTISYNMDNTTFNCVLNGSNQVTKITSYYNDGEFCSEETIGYQNNYISLTDGKTNYSENSEYGKFQNELTWSDGNMKTINWRGNYGHIETVTIAYNDLETKRINIDLNWFLYNTESLQYVAGAEFGIHILLSQGYCGAKNKNLLSGHKRNFNNEPSFSSTFTYELNAEGLPVEIYNKDDYYTGSDRTITIEYKK